MFGAWPYRWAISASRGSWRAPPPWQWPCWERPTTCHQRRKKVSVAFQKCFNLSHGSLERYWIILTCLIIFRYFLVYFTLGINKTWCELNLRLGFFGVSACSHRKTPWMSWLWVVVAESMPSPWSSGSPPRSDMSTVRLAMAVLLWRTFLLGWYGHR